jgi:hypothetical protein
MAAKRRKSRKKTKQSYLLVFARLAPFRGGKCLRFREASGSQSQVPGKFPSYKMPSDDEVWNLVCLGAFLELGI